MDYTCNAIKKDGSKTFFCNRQLSHDGDHEDGTMTWPQVRFDDEDSPPIW